MPVGVLGKVVDHRVLPVQPYGPGTLVIPGRLGDWAIQGPGGAADTFVDHTYDIDPAGFAGGANILCLVPYDGFYIRLPQSSACPQGASVCVKLTYLSTAVTIIPAIASETLYQETIDDVTGVALYGTGISITGAFRSITFVANPGTVYWYVQWFVNAMSDPASG